MLLNPKLSLTCSKCTLEKHILQLQCEVLHPSMAHRWSIDQPFNLVLGIFDYCLGLKLVLV